MKNLGDLHDAGQDARRAGISVVVAVGLVCERSCSLEVDFVYERPALVMSSEKQVYKSVLE